MTSQSRESGLVTDQVGDMVSTPAIKKETVLERLNKRNKDRQNYLDVKLEQRNKENVQLEGEDYFAQAFAQRTREIQARIENINEIASKKANGDVAPRAEMTRLFTDITMEIQELQRYLTTSTMFLTDFKVKSCQYMLSELSKNLDEARIRVIPKKKFGFAGKKTVAKATPSIDVDKMDAPEKPKFKFSSKAFEWTLADRETEYICLRENEVNGQDITISNLKDCFVELLGHPGSVQVSNAINCTLLSGPISRSLFAENCENCSFVAACQQLRLHSSSDCRIYLHVTCRAIIEDCKQIEIADYNYSYPEINIDFEKAQLDRHKNNYTDVADFNWLSVDVASPNWKLMPESLPRPDWDALRQKFQESTIDANDNKVL